MLRAMERPAERREMMAQDPVYGMALDPETAPERVQYQGQTYVFCSADCRRAFERDPERYARPATSAEDAYHAHH